MEVIIPCYSFYLGDIWDRFKTCNSINDHKGYLALDSPAEGKDEEGFLPC
jgi:hypothetical protein